MGQEQIDLSDPVLVEMLKSPYHQLYVAYPPKICANCGKKVYYPGTYRQIQIFRFNQQADLNKMTPQDLIRVAHICEQCFKTIPEKACSENVIIPGNLCICIAQKDKDGKFKTIFALTEAVKKALPTVMQGIKP